MAKYIMRSFYGNEIKEVDTERKRDELKELGFTVIKEETEGVNLDKMKVSELEAFAESKVLTYRNVKTEKKNSIKSKTQSKNN